MLYILNKVVFEVERNKLTSYNLKPTEQVTLEPYERDHALIVGVYRPTKKEKNTE